MKSVNINEDKCPECGSKEHSACSTEYPIMICDKGHKFWVNH